ncbi:hypothetical protein ABNK63_00465 [Rhodanobacter sp. IGA1.0]|uniref:Uncharacterized protein n=1 Tax=Rhodanobacter sp. IGA1.0 TaxID=3158582 RepID=A0AAU7QLE8_9GAMM
MDLRFGKSFHLLAQEGHLAKSALLSGFDFLLRAEANANKDGQFYAAFFQLSIGIERLLKLVVVAQHMLENNFVSPTPKQLKGDYGHDILALYASALSTREKHGLPLYSPEKQAIFVLSFLSNFAVHTRYYNLNTLSDRAKTDSPLDEWADVASDLYKGSVSAGKSESQALKLMQQLDKMPGNTGGTYQLDRTGHPMTVFDVYWRAYKIKAARPLAIWILIQALHPLYAVFDAIGMATHEIDVSTGKQVVSIPYLEEFFPFLLADKPTTLRRKRWLSIFE